MKSFNDLVKDPDKFTDGEIEKFRDYILKGMRSGSNNYKSIMFKVTRGRVRLIGTSGLFNRLVIEKGIVSYQAGQSHTDEMRRLRELIVKGK